MKTFLYLPSKLILYRMKRTIINSISAILALIAFILILCDSDKTSTLILSKTAGIALLYLASKLFERYNEEETV